MDRVSKSEGRINFTCILLKFVFAAQETPTDLVSLSEVSESQILRAVEQRFAQEEIYTACGSVLMAINPFSIIPGLYGSEVIRRYGNPHTYGLPPHVYLLASRAYFQLQSHGLSQCILIRSVGSIKSIFFNYTSIRSGESGSGKTEATKQCLHFLSQAAQTLSTTQGSLTPRIPSDNAAAKLIVASSPILEAFGNAKTMRNSNSSRCKLRTTHYRYFF
jgi:myosin heavy subunit